MKILIDMGHPAHVHLFKNFIWEMEELGHDIKVTARDKEVTRQLLDAYHIPYELVGKPFPGKFSLFREWIGRTYTIAKIGKQFNADMYIGVLNPATAFSAWINRKISLTLTDTEHAKFAIKATFPFTNHILTPSCYIGDIGEKQIRYNGYHELAYLHPNYFTPNPAVLTELGLTETDPLIIVRFVSWNASHDVGQHGLTLDTRRKAIHEFEKYGRVFITSEKPMSEEFERYCISVSPEKMHDLLYYATLLYGESATMASECAVLGTHAIFCDFTGRGYTNEEEKVYNLVYNFKLDESSLENSIKKAAELLKDPNLKENGRKKQAALLKDKIDVTAFMVWFVENYTESVVMKKGN
jgi:hypothetical protein